MNRNTVKRTDIESDKQTDASRAGLLPSEGCGVKQEGKGIQKYFYSHPDFCWETVAAVLASGVKLNTCVGPHGLDSNARLRVDVILGRVWSDSARKIPLITHDWFTADSRWLPFFNLYLL